jgi:signal transduction histidine kinase
MTIRSIVVKPSRKSVKHASPLVIEAGLPVIDSQVHLVHEIRNPLTNIYLALNELQSITKEEEPLIYLNIIRNNTSRINGLVNEMLQSAKSDHLTIKKYNINQVLDETLELAKDRIMLKHIGVLKLYTKQFCEVSLDLAQIKIALLNIIINAIEAMPDQQGELTLLTKIQDGKCVVIIGDNGIGISKANIEKIFTPYFTSKETGMGLGLAVTFEILRSHKATIKVDYSENTGTRFILSFTFR